MTVLSCTYRFLYENCEGLNLENSIMLVIFQNISKFFKPTRMNIFVYNYYSYSVTQLYGSACNCQI